MADWAFAGASEVGRPERWAARLKLAAARPFTQGMDPNGPRPEEGVRGALRGLIDWAVLLGSTPVVAIYGGMSLMEGHWSWSLAALFAVQLSAMVIAVLGKAGRLPNRGRLYTFYLVALVVASAAHFGPLMAVGVLAMGIVIAASVFFDRQRHVMAVSAVAVGAMWLVAAFTIHTRPAHLTHVDLTSSPIWLRILVATMAGMIVLGLLLSRMLQSLERAYREAWEALEGERRAHAERERLLGELERSRRLEDIGRLAGGVAHDVNNAFAVVLSNAELMGDELGRVAHGASGQPLRELVGEIRGAALGAKRVVADLMLLGQPRTGAIATCDPTRTIERMVHTLRRLLPERIALEFQSEARGLVPLEEAQLRRVVMNLVLNARDAIEDGGTIAIALRGGPSISLSVADDGVGMTEEIFARIFDPFFTTKRVGEGTGLGLPAVQGLVEAAGGRITVESAPGEGTRFEIVLPRATRATRAAVPSERPRPTVSGRAATILLVEDDRAVRRSTSRLLRAEGHRVVEASDEAEARARMVEERFDLLVTDVVMPNSNCSQLIDAFVTRFPGRPVIVCSGWVEEELVRQGIDTGAYTQLHKPFERDTLLAAVGETRLEPGDPPAHRAAASHARDEPSSAAPPPEPTRPEPVQQLRA